MNIEDIAAASPDAILKFPIDIHHGMTHEKAVEIAKKLEIPSSDHAMVAETLQKLYNLFISKDATMVEINPFAEAADGGCKYLTLEIKTKCMSSFLCYEKLYFTEVRIFWPISEPKMLFGGYHCSFPIPRSDYPKNSWVVERLKVLLLCALIGLVKSGKAGKEFFKCFRTVNLSISLLLSY